jgi:hypothetical protein
MKRSSRTVVDWSLGLDLMEMVLSHVGMDLQSFVRVGLVCKAWRSVCRSSPMLLVNVAARSELRTILVCERLFALSMDEAKRFAMIRGVPRESGGSVLFFGSVLTSMGGMAGWQDRLTKRARAQASIERTYGPDWREIREAFRRRMM